MKKYKLIIFLFLVSCIVPVLLLLFYSFIEKWLYPEIVPSNFTFDNFKYAIESNVLRVCITSVIVGIVTGIFTLLISFPTAKALAHYQFKYKNFLTLLILLPLITSPFVIVAISHINLIRLGLDGTIIGVCLVHTMFAIPYAVRILYDHFQIAGVKAEQTASSLGASPIQVFKYITVPSVSEGILLSFFFSFTISISQYITTLIIGGGKVSTLSTLLVPYVQYGNYELASVYSILIIVVSLICYVFTKLIAKILKRMVWS